MKILIATTFYPPEGRAGTEVYTQTVASELCRRGHEVEVVCVTGWSSGANHWNGVQEDAVDGVRVLRLALNWQKAPRPNSYLFDNPAVGEWFGQWLCTSQPDIVHVISCLTLSVSIINVAKAHGKPVLITLMDYWFICPRNTLLRYNQMLCDGRTTTEECLKCLTARAKVFRWPARVLPERGVLIALGLLSRIEPATVVPGVRGLVLNTDRIRQGQANALRKAELVISHSRFLADTFAGAGIDVPIRVVANGHDLSWLTDCVDRSERKHLRFATLSHASEIKGVHIAIEAFQKLSAKANAELWIFGRIDDRTEYGMRLIAAASRVPQVTLKGIYDHADLNAILSQVDVVIVPSQWYENAPLVIYEAFAAKKPVIATNLGGMAEAVHHDESGLLFDMGDSGSLSRQIARLITDPGLLRRLRDGIPPVRTVSDEVGELLAIYEQIA